VKGKKRSDVISVTFVTGVTKGERARVCRAIKSVRDAARRGKDPLARASAFNARCALSPRERELRLIHACPRRAAQRGNITEIYATNLESGWRGGGKGRISDFIEKRSGLLLSFFFFLYREKKVFYFCRRHHRFLARFCSLVTSSAIRSLELRDGRGLIGVSLAARNDALSSASRLSLAFGFVSSFGQTALAGVTVTREIHPLLVISVARLRANPLVHVCTSVPHRSRRCGVLANGEEGINRE